MLLPWGSEVMEFPLWATCFTVSWQCQPRPLDYRVHFKKRLGKRDVKKFYINFFSKPRTILGILRRPRTNLWIFSKPQFMKYPSHFDELQCMYFKVLVLTNINFKMCQCTVVHSTIIEKLTKCQTAWLQFEKLFEHTFMLYLSRWFPGNVKFTHKLEHTWGLINFEPHGKLLLLKVTSRRKTKCH